MCLRASSSSHRRTSMILDENAFSPEEMDKRIDQAMTARL